MMELINISPPPSPQGTSHESSPSCLPPPYCPASAFSFVREERAHSVYAAARELMSFFGIPKSDHFRTIYIVLDYMGTCVRLEF